jgi:hypothetical protein
MENIYLQHFIEALSSNTGETLWVGIPSISGKSENHKGVKIKQYQTTRKWSIYLSNHPSSHFVIKAREGGDEASSKTQILSSPNTKASSLLLLDSDTSLRRSSISITPSSTAAVPHIIPLCHFIHLSNLRILISYSFQL